MKTLFVIPIEPIETRYTKHWFEYVPDMIQENVSDDIHVCQLEIFWDQSGTSDGAFLDFTDTTNYKSIQMSHISNMFKHGLVERGDAFLFMDYWNPVANMVRYMSVLNGIPVNIMGICHAGGWDIADILGQRFRDHSIYDDTHRRNRWIIDVESGLDSLYDAKFFATNFSKELYEKTHKNNTETNFVTGFPMEYYDKVMTPYWELKNPPEKENIVCFPHRKSPEKGLKQFHMLEKEHPEYEFIVSMDVCKNKEEYHDLLYRSKFCFSASKQETLGISMGIEALRAGCDVLVPDRLSYQEMFLDPFKYQVSGMQSLDTIRSRLENGPNKMDLIKYQHDLNYLNYFNGNKMYHKIEQIMKSV